MAMRGEQYREAIRSVVAIFGPHADDFVFLGSCVLGLYMRPRGGPFRPTIDTDVVSLVRPWTVQEERLARLCEQNILLPDERILCRYHVPSRNIAVDVLSPEGMNVGGITDWFLQAGAQLRGCVPRGRPRGAAEASAHARAASYRGVGCAMGLCGP